jgi:hypothetical protein
MQASDFTIGQRFHHPDHRAYLPEEIFTVVKVESDYITVQSNQDRWRDTPLIMTAVALSVKNIVFLEPGETVEVIKPKKVLPGWVPPVPKKRERKLKKAVAEAESVVEFVGEPMTIEEISEGVEIE